jgi:hypothetical protein
MMIRAAYVNGDTCDPKLFMLYHPKWSRIGRGAVARKLTDEVQLKLRFDERLRRRLEKAAEQHLFSMNREIIERLEQSFSAEDQAAQFDELKRLLTERDREIVEVRKLMQELRDTMREAGETGSFPVRRLEYPLMRRLFECQAAGIDIVPILTEALDKMRSKS